MAEEFLGIFLSLAAVFAVLALAALLRRRAVSAEVTRKLTHILLSGWVLLALWLLSKTWSVCVPPALFVALNYISYRKGLFSGIERDEGNTLGTVWYALSLLVLCAVFWSLKKPWIAACGMLAMGLGDGLAALVGLKWGRRRFPVPLAEKTAEGTLAAMIFSGISVGAVCAVYAPKMALAAGIFSAALAAAVELCSPRGLDNLTLPLSVGLGVWLLAEFPVLTPAFYCVAVTLIILLAAFYLNTITLWGSAAALVSGSVYFYFGGWVFYSALVGFFLLGSAVSRFGKSKKKAASALHHRRGPRGAIQVAANALPGLILAAVFSVAGEKYALSAVLATFAAAAADTFSSEIGMLSPARPVSILTLKPVRQGLSGGVTLLGLGGAVLGAGLISLLALPGLGGHGMALVWGAGVFGSLLDSAMGALLQAKYQLPDGGITERPEEDGKPLPLASGLLWMNNDMVNFLSILLSGGLTFILPR